MNASPTSLPDPLAVAQTEDGETVPEAADDGPVTILVSRRIKKGAEEEFEQLLRELSETLEQHQGFRGLKAYKPGAPGEEHEVVLSFDSTDDLAAWRASPQRKAWLEQVQRLDAAPPRAKILTGMESWFTLPEQEGMKAPPRHKMALVTWLGVFPFITLVNAVLGPHIEHLPVWARSAIVSAIMVCSMTYLVMPRMTRLLAPFLYPEIDLPGRKLEESNK